MNRRAPPRRIAVVGGGPVAAAAALAFAQALPGARVVLVPAAVPDAALADRWPLALPSTHATLARLQCPPDLLRAHGVASPRLACRFLNWSRDGAAWMAGDEPLPPAPGGVPLHHLWLRAGEPLPFHRLDPACAAAAAGRVPAGAEPALSLDPQRLMAGLTSLARQAGVAIEAPLEIVHPDASGIAALTLADGTRVEADLFIDATGPARRLSAATPFIDWSEALPFHHVRITPAATAGSPVETYRARTDGWGAEWPGATVDASADAGNSSRIAFAPGRLSAPMRGNVLAVGEAAVQPGPLLRMGFTLALGQIALALELLPTGADTPLLSEEYNRRAGQRADRMRDFLAAHHLARDGARPASLAPILARFTRHGSIPAADEDAVPRDGWIAMLIGQGLRPERPNPIALGIAPDVARRAIADMAGTPAQQGPVR